MIERTRLISCLLYGLFSAGKKTGSAFQYPFARERDHSRPRSLNRENPGRAIETRRDSKNSFFKGTVKTVSLKMRQFLRQDLGQI